MTLSAIIVDDEPALIEHLKSKLNKLWPELEIVGDAVNGRQAIALAVEVQPDIAFLDIKMPGLTGLQVAEMLPADIKIVFVTAYDDHAVDAFERAAVDYLLKPVADQRLEETIRRLQSDQNRDRDDLVALIKQIAPNTQSYIQWIRAGLDDNTSLVSVDDIVYFQADHKYTTIATPQREYVVRKSIKELEQELDPNVFWRVHRGAIVRVDQIESAKRDLRGRYTLAFRQRPESIRTSQSYSHLFKQM